MRLYLRLVAVALVPLFVANAVLWWPLTKLGSVFAVALIFYIPRALRYALDD